jgi:hypothetical protein
MFYYTLIQDKVMALWQSAENYVKPTCKRLMWWVQPLRTTPRSMRQSRIDFLTYRTSSGDSWGEL